MEKLTAISLNNRHVLMTFFLIFGMFFLFHLVHQPVIDWDEEVYLHLSKQMTWNLERYTTQNSHIDEQLPQAYYRSPLFHHPPLIPFGIKLLSFAGYLTGAKILNLILWCASIFLVFAIACKFTDLKGAILALTLWVICPIVNLEVRLVHLDFPSTVLTLLGFWFFLKIPGSGSQTYLFGWFRRRFRPIHVDEIYRTSFGVFTSLFVYYQPGPTQGLEGLGNLWWNYIVRVYLVALHLYAIRQYHTSRIRW